MALKYIPPRWLWKTLGLYTDQPVGIGTTPVANTSLTTASPVHLADGTVAAPALAMASDADTGLYTTGVGWLNWAFGGVCRAFWTGTAWRLGSLVLMSWSSNADASAASGDTAIRRADVGTIGISNSGTDANVTDNKLRVYGAKGAYWEMGSASEEITIAAAATTLSAANLLPANSIIEGVSVRVTTAIPTAATFKVGIAGGADDAYGSGLNVAANTTNAVMVSAANAAAAKILITPNVQPAAATGKVRVCVHYRTLSAPTS